MRYLRLTCFAATLLTMAAFGTAQDGPPLPEPEVLTRGPIHEAYAATTNLQPTPGQMAPKGPPENIEELPPDQRPEGDAVQWIPGYFAWDEERGEDIPAMAPRRVPTD